MYPFPIETITQFSTITTLQAAGEFAVEMLVSTLASVKINFVVGAIVATVSVALNTGNVTTKIAELTSVELPPKNKGAYYRFDTTYKNNQMNILIRAWLSEANYNSWAGRLAAGEYVSAAEEPIFTCEILKKLPGFAD